MTDASRAGRKDELVHEMGQLILQDERLAAHEWQAIASVFEFHGTQRQRYGYRYDVDGSSEALSLQNGFRLIRKAEELLAAMTTDGSPPWHQALLQVWRPGPQIRIQFEYDDPRRWSVKKVSMDMSGHAATLRPPEA